MKTEGSRVGVLILRTVAFLLATIVPMVLTAPAEFLPKPGGVDWARLAAWASCLVGMVILFVLAGLRIQGRILGVLIDERNRYSLSRVQVTAWTALILSSLYVTMVANSFRSVAGIDALNITVDYNVVALMGLSLASFVAAPFALKRKADQTGAAADLATTSQQLLVNQKLESAPTASGRLLVKGSPRDARLADLVRGEDIDDASVVDIPRLQMLAITVVVVFGYGVAMTHCLATGGAQLSRLPELHQTVLLLILMSHGGYLAGKLTPATTDGVGPEIMDRTLRASTLATSLAVDAQTTLSSTASGSPKYSMAQTQAALTQSLASDAADMVARVSTPGFPIQDVSFIEGRLSALRGTLGAISGGTTASDVVNAPSPDVVRSVQEKLARLNYGVVATGIPDAATEDALRVCLATKGVNRADLHPAPYRYYEEASDLI